MKLEAEQNFTVQHPGPPEATVAFVQDLPRSLEHVPFIKNLRIAGDEIHAYLIVDVPFLGEQRLDFHSTLERTPTGAILHPQTRTGRAWAEVSGNANVSRSSSIDYQIRIVVHLELPDAGTWGARAFEKMAQSTAQRAIERMSIDFPKGVQAAALPGPTPE